MQIRKQIFKFIPTPIKNHLTIRQETKELREIPRLECNVANLKSIHDIALSEIFASPDIEKGWLDIKKRIDAFVIPDLTGGVNPGDRRAIYYLISRFKPASVLEVGTHIGASTLHISSALFANLIQYKKPASLTTVDIADVNDPVSKPWLRCGTEYSPREMMEKMQFGSFVKFVKSPSLDFFAKCDQKFDFIFLDGNHEAKTVYKEIQPALNLLNQGGVILLHDYFPNLKPLWSDGSVIPGPFLATERLKSEGAKLSVLPLGGLPWPTKLQSNVTSLALLLRKDT